MSGSLLSSYRTVFGSLLNGQTRGPRDSMCDVGAFEVQRQPRVQPIAIPFVAQAALPSPMSEQTQNMHVTVTDYAAITGFPCGTLDAPR